MGTFVENMVSSRHTLERSSRYMGMQIEAHLFQPNQTERTWVLAFDTPDGQVWREFQTMNAAFAYADRWATQRRLTVRIKTMQPLPDFDPESESVLVWWHELDDVEGE